MADNRKILNKVRGAKGAHFVYGDEDALAAAYGQDRLDTFKRAGFIEGDWKSTKPEDQPDLGAKVAVISTAAESEFKPLSVEETIERMKDMDFSEEVTKSMTFHGDALKDALKNVGKAKSKTGDDSGDKGAKNDGKPKESAKPDGKSKEGESQTDENATDDYPQGFPPLIKGRLVKLGKTYAEIKALPKEKLVELNGIADTSADEILDFIAKENK